MQPASGNLPPFALGTHSYNPAQPAATKDVPTLMKPMFFPMTASVSAIGVEYGLYQGRFWLPRLQVLEGGATMGLIRLPFKLEQKFQYDQVNGTDKLPPIVVATDTGPRGTGGAAVRIGSGTATTRDSAMSRRAQRLAA